MSDVLKRTLLPRLMPQRLLILRGPAQGGAVALTFDDGPDGMTREYLELLDDLRVRATFFLLGQQVQKHSDLVLEYLRRGHELAGHGFTHRRFPSLSREALEDEVRRTQDLLPPVPGPLTLVRPPQGATTARSLLLCAALGYSTVLWSLDTLDYRLKTGAEIVAHVAAQPIGPGEILLLHEGQRWTLDALPGIVQDLRERGLRLVTLSELLQGAGR